MVTMIIIAIISNIVMLITINNVNLMIIVTSIIGGVMTMTIDCDVKACPNKG